MQAVVPVPKVKPRGRGFAGCAVASGTSSASGAVGAPLFGLLLAALGLVSRRPAAERRRTLRRR